LFLKRALSARSAMRREKHDQGREGIHIRPKTTAKKVRPVSRTDLR
jgi:hypothetical protein